MAENDFLALNSGLHGDQVEGLAHAIGYVFGLDSDRVRAILRRTRVLNKAGIEVPSKTRPDDIRDGEWVRFEPDLMRALTFLNPEFALDLFEKESTEMVKIIVGAVQASTIVVPTPWFLRG